MKKILVLGTGNAQADFISYCKAYGLEVHSCSYRQEGRGIQLSDHFEVMNITDSERVSEYVRQRGINLIYSVGSELAMPTISRVSEECSLPVFNTTKTTTTCQNKQLMRASIRDCSEFTVEFREVKDFENVNGWSLFPAVVKPVDSQGQRGITFVKDKSELRNAFERAIAYSSSKTVIIEEYIEGFEISVNTYVSDGYPLMSFITERISFNQYPGGIIKSHQFPVLQKLNIDKISLLLKSVLSKLNITDGPAYLQIKVNKYGDPKVIEVTPRLDGCHLWRMIYYLQEIHLFEVILDHLFNGKIKESAIQPPLHAGQINPTSLDFFTQSPSSLMSKDLHHAKKDAIYTEWYYRNGEVVSTINGYAEKVGFQIHRSS